MAQLTATNISTQALGDFLKAFEPMIRKKPRTYQDNYLELKITPDKAKSLEGHRNYWDYTDNVSLEGMAFNGANFLEVEMRPLGDLVEKISPEDKAPRPGQGIVQGDWKEPLYVKIDHPQLKELVNDLKSVKVGPDDGLARVNITIDVPEVSTEYLEPDLGSEYEGTHRYAHGSLSVQSISDADGNPQNNIRFTDSAEVRGQSQVEPMRKKLEDLLESEVKDHWEFVIPIGYAAQASKLKTDVKNIIKQRQDSFGPGAKYRLKQFEYGKPGEGDRTYLVPRQVPWREEYPKGRQTSQMVFQLAGKMDEDYDREIMAREGIEIPHAAISDGEIDTSPPASAQVSFPTTLKPGTGDLDPKKKSFPHFVVTHHDVLEDAFSGLPDKDASSPIFVQVPYPSTKEFEPGFRGQENPVVFNTSGGDGGSASLDYKGAFVQGKLDDKDREYLALARNPSKDTSYVNPTRKPKPIDRSDWQPYVEPKKQIGLTERVGGRQLFTIKADNLAQSVNQVKGAYAKEDSRPILTKIHFDMATEDGEPKKKVDSVDLVAADGFVLATANVPLESHISQTLEEWDGDRLLDWYKNSSRFNLEGSDLTKFIKDLGGEHRGLKAKDGGALEGNVTFFLNPDEPDAPGSITMVGKDKKGNEIIRDITMAPGSYPKYRSLLPGQSEAQYLAMVNPKDAEVAFDIEGRMKNFLSTARKQMKQKEGEFGGYGKVQDIKKVGGSSFSYGSNLTAQQALLTETPDGKLVVMDRSAALASGKALAKGGQAGDFHHLVDTGKNIAIDPSFLQRNREDEFHIAVAPNILDHISTLGKGTDDDITIYATDERSPLTATSEPNESGIRYTKVMMPLFTHGRSAVVESVNFSDSADPGERVFKYPEILNITHTLKDGELVPTKEMEDSIKATGGQYLARQKWYADHGVKDVEQSDMAQLRADLSLGVLNKNSYVYMNPFLPSRGELLSEEELRQAVAKQHEGWPGDVGELKKAKEKGLEELKEKYQATAWKPKEETPATKEEVIEKVKEFKKKQEKKKKEKIQGDLEDPSTNDSPTSDWPLIKEPLSTGKLITDAQGDVAVQVIYPGGKIKATHKIKDLAESFHSEVPLTLGTSYSGEKKQIDFLNENFLKGEFDQYIAPGHYEDPDQLSFTRDYDGATVRAGYANPTIGTIVQEIRTFGNSQTVDAASRNDAQRRLAGMDSQLGLGRRGAELAGVYIGHLVPGLDTLFRTYRDGAAERTRYLKDLEYEVRNQYRSTEKNPDRKREELLKKLSKKRQKIEGRDPEMVVHLDVQRRAALNYADKRVEEDMRNWYMDFAVLHNELKKFKESDKDWNPKKGLKWTDGSDLNEPDRRIREYIDRNWDGYLREAYPEVATKFTKADIEHELEHGLGTKSVSPGAFAADNEKPSIRMANEINHQAERWEREVFKRKELDQKFFALKGENITDMEPGVAWRTLQQTNPPDFERYLAMKGIGKGRGKGKANLDYQTEILRISRPNQEAGRHIFMELDEEAKKRGGSKLSKAYKKFSKKPDLKNLEELEKLATEKDLFLYHGTLGSDPVYVTDIVPAYGLNNAERLDYIQDFKDAIRSKGDTEMTPQGIGPGIRSKSAIDEYIDSGVYKVLKWADENKIDSETDKSNEGKQSKNRNPGLHVMSWKYPQSGKFPFKEGIPLALDDKETIALTQLTRWVMDGAGKRDREALVRFDDKTRNSATTLDPVGYVMLGKGFKEFDGRGALMTGSGEDRPDKAAVTKRKRGMAQSTDFVVKSKDEPALKGAIFEAWTDNPKGFGPGIMVNKLRPVEAYFPWTRPIGSSISDEWTVIAGTETQPFNTRKEFTHYVRAQPDIPYDSTLNSLWAGARGELLGPPNKIMVGEKGFIPYSRAAHRFAMAADVGYPHTVKDLSNPERWSGTGKPMGFMHRKIEVAKTDEPKVGPGYASGRRYPRSVTYDARRKSPVTGKVLDRKHFEKTNMTSGAEETLLANYTGPDRVASYYWWLLPNRADIPGIDTPGLDGNIVLNLDSDEPNAPYNGKKAFVASPWISKHEKPKLGPADIKPVDTSTGTNPHYARTIQRSLMDGFTKRERGLMDQAVISVVPRTDQGVEGTLGVHRSNAYGKPYSDRDYAKRGNPTNAIQISGKAIEKPSTHIHKTGPYKDETADDDTTIHEVIHLLRDVDDKRSDSVRGRRGWQGRRSLATPLEQHRDQDLEEAMTDAETTARMPARTTPMEKVGGYYQHIADDIEVREIPSSPLAPGKSMKVRVFNYDRAPSDPNKFYGPVRSKEDPSKMAGHDYIPMFRGERVGGLESRKYRDLRPGRGGPEAAMLANEGMMYDKMVLNQYIHPKSKQGRIILEKKLKHAGNMVEDQGSADVTVGKTGLDIPKHDAALAMAMVAEDLGILPNTQFPIDQYVLPLVQLRKTNPEQYDALKKDLEEIKTVGLKSLQGNKAINRVRKVFPQLAISKMKIHGDKESIDTYWDVEHNSQTGLRSTSRVHLRSDPDQSTQASRIDAVVPDLIREGASISVTEYRDGRGHPVKIPKSAQPKVRGQKKTRAPKKSARVQKPGRVQQYQDKITGKKYMRRKNGPMPTGKRFLALK